MRHGDADAEVPEGLTDEARALTAKARHQILAHFSGLVDRMNPVSLILTSPLVRAVQTAQILGLAQKHDGPLRVHRCLLPDMPVGALESAISDHGGQDLIFVGHQPSMGAAAAHLLGIQQLPKNVTPGSVTGLERAENQNGFRLLFFAAPGQPVVDSF